MKKVLLATTAMVLSAGVAYAEVSISGNARMGLQSDSTDDAGVSFEKRINLNFSGSVETTSGITFGASLRARSNEGATTGFNGGRVYMSTGGVEVAVGNIYGAIDSMPNLYHSEVGLTGLGAGDVGGLVGFAYDGYSSNGNGAEGVEVIYSSGAVSAHLSYSDTDLGSANNRTAAHVAYTSGDLTAAIGGQSSDDADEDLVAVTLAGKVGDFSVGVSAMDADVGRQITLAGSAAMGATTVSAFISDSSAETATETAFGMGLSYDLGGASLLAGVQRDTVGETQADFGVSFSF